MSFLSLVGSLQIHTFCFFFKTESNPRSERGKRRADIVITSDTIHRLLCNTEMYFKRAKEEES